MEGSCSTVWEGLSRHHCSRRGEARNLLSLNHKVAGDKDGDKKDDKKKDKKKDDKKGKDAKVLPNRPKYPFPVSRAGFRGCRLGCGVQGVRCRVWGVGCSVWDAGCGYRQHSRALLKWFLSFGLYE